jgi:DinB superfamily
MKNSETINESIWSQFGASLDMLENAIKMCPNDLWDTPTDFWYQSYHCVFWTDYYLSLEPDSFVPPKPFTFSEFDLSGIKPDRTYTKTEVLDYLQHCREKAFKMISELSSEQLLKRWINEYKDYTLLEILLYNMRHVQHHAAKLNMCLREKFDNAPNWVGKA